MRTARRGTRAAAAWFVVGGSLLLGGCSVDPNVQQSILAPRGERAEAVIGLWELMLVLGTVVWVLVTGALIVAVLRRRRKVDQDLVSRGADDPDPADGRRPFWLIATAGALVPAVVIALLTAVSATVLRDIDPEQETDGPVIEVIAHQYWWEVHYPDYDVTTANEIHIPTGVKVRLELGSADVIHSFWVPELSGKVDTIPGRTNALWLSTDEPGTYWGQCAEFCGLDHALMRMLVISHSPAEFDGWIAAQQEPAPRLLEVNATESIERGQQIFMSSSCVYCHTIEGTAAQGDVGPDLTHIAGREALAAGILPNDRGNLAGWIIDPQSIKPGNQMPGTDLDGEDLQYLLDYLESLE